MNSESWCQCQLCAITKRHKLIFDAQLNAYSTWHSRSNNEIIFICWVRLSLRSPPPQWTNGWQIVDRAWRFWTWLPRHWRARQWHTQEMSPSFINQWVLYNKWNGRVKKEEKSSRAVCDVAEGQWVSEGVERDVLDMSYGLQDYYEWHRTGRSGTH